MAVFGRKESAGQPEDIYLRLRSQLLATDPADMGVVASPELPRVWALMMETGYPKAVVTFVAVADGTTSLYISNDGGMIGAGEHEQVAAATRRLLIVVEQHLDQMPASDDVALPATGQVVLRALIRSGFRRVESTEDDLGHGRHPLSVLFHAVQDVITQIRLVEESRH